MHPIKPIVLEGQHVRLEPLSLSHVDALCDIGLDPDLWKWIPIPVRTQSDMREYVESALDDQHRGYALPFATREAHSKQVVGSTRFAAIDMPNRRLEIGWTWVAKPWQRTAVNTEAKYLMLGHAFDVLGCRRVEFKTDSLNERSRRAIARLGAKEEGTFRKHMTTESGRVRDSVYYSVIDSEWKVVKEKLERILACDA